MKNSDHIIFTIEPRARPVTIEKAPFDALLRLIDDHKLSARFTLAFERLHLYSELAAAQNKRIWQSYKQSKKAARSGNRKSAWHHLNVASIECHFYFTCWDCVRKILSALANDASFTAPGKVWKRHSAVFKEYKVIRDHLEHYDERLPAGSRTDFIEDEPNSLEGTLPIVGDGYFGYQHRRWDVGPSSVRLLRSIISDLESELRPELQNSVDAAFTDTSGKTLNKIEHTFSDLESG